MNSHADYKNAEESCDGSRQTSHPNSWSPRNVKQNRYTQTNVQICFWYGLFFSEKNRSAFRLSFRQCKFPVSIVSDGFIWFMFGAHEHSASKRIFFSLYWLTRIVSISVKNIFYYFPGTFFTARVLRQENRVFIDVCLSTGWGVLPSPFLGAAGGGTGYSSQTCSQEGTPVRLVLGGTPGQHLGVPLEQDRGTPRHDKGTLPLDRIGYPLAQDGGTYPKH